MATFTTGETTGTVVLANATIDRYMVARLLEVAMYNMTLGRLGRKVPVPKGESTTVSFTRVEHLALPLAPALEGVTPPATPMSTTRVTCVLEQWIQWVDITDVAEMTVRYQPFQRALERLGIAAARVWDRECYRVLLGGTNVFFPGTVTARSGLTTASFPDTRTLRRVRAALKNAGAPFYDGRRYAGVCDSYNAMDIQADATFVDSAVYQDRGVLTDAELGVWMGTRWNETNVFPILVLNANTNATNAAVAGNGTETLLIDDDYYVRITGNNASGFETDFWAILAAFASTADVLEITLPAAPAGITSFNVYVGLLADGTDLRLHAERVAAAGKVRVSGNGSGTDTFNASGYGTLIHAAFDATTGRIAGVAPATGVSVHTMFVFGSDYFAVTELEAIRTLRAPAGASKSDPADQHRPIAWKSFMKACITDHTFGAKIECATDYA